MMKKLISVMLLIVFLFSLSVPAMAMEDLVVRKPTPPSKPILATQFDGVGIVKVKPIYKIQPYGKEKKTTYQVSFIHRNKEYQLTGNINGMEKLDGKHVRLKGFIYGINSNQITVFSYQPIPKENIPIKAFDKETLLFIQGK